jgi:putative ABC transport system permease protein
MFLRLLYESFRRQRRRKALAGVAILLGTTAVTAMLALATTIGDRIHAELAVYGANIVVTPQAANLDVKIGDTDLKPATGDAYLNLMDFEKLRTIFWANNITGVSPELSRHLQLTFPTANQAIKQPLDVVTKGVYFDQEFAGYHLSAPALHPSWKLAGSWPAEAGFSQLAKGEPESSFHGQAVVGKQLAESLGIHVGDEILLSGSPLLEDRRAYGGQAPLRVVGIVSTGDETDNGILTHFQMVWALSRSLPINAVSRVEISARTKPEDAFARQDPDKLSPAQREIWYCRPYANSIAYQIQEAIPGAHAEQVRRVEQSEGTVLSRISGLMWLISAAALLAAGFAVSAAMATAILERRAEIGLMRSLGAAKSSIALLFYAETGLLALFSGTLGYLLGSALAAWLGAHIFPGNVAPAATHLAAFTAAFNPVLLPVAVGLALLVAMTGSTPSIRTALRLDPANILRADA